MSLGQGCMSSISTKQKLNTRSSTEAELVAVNDAMSKILWTRLFIESQGYHVADNVLYQDNQSAMLLEKNGKMSSSKRTRHLDIRFFFVTDNVQKKNVRIEYCPTDDMVGDFYTKPLQGSKFVRFKNFSLGVAPPLRTMPVDPVRKECVEDSIIEDSIILDESDESGPLTSWTEVAGKKKKKTDGPKPIKLEGKQSVEKLTLFTKRS